MLWSNFCGVTYAQIRSDFILAEAGKEPSITLDNMGRLHATWVGGKGIKYGLFDSLGNPIQASQEFTMGGFSDSPQLAVSAEFAVVFWRHFFPGYYSSIAGILFHINSGNIIGTFDNYKGDNINIRPDIKFLYDSTIIAIWTGDGPLTPYPYTGVYGQFFTSSLDTIAGLQLFNDDMPQRSEHSYARIAINQKIISSLVVWREKVSAFSSQVFGRQFNSKLQRGASFLMSDLPDSIHVWSPSAIMDAQGEFNVVWSTGKASSLHGNVYLRRFRADGIPLGPSKKVNAGPAVGYAEVDISQDVDGRFVVVWEGQEKNVTIMVQRFDSNSFPIGSNFKPGAASDSLNQYSPRVVLRNGKMYTAWRERIRVDSSNVWASIIDFDNVPVSVKNRTAEVPEPFQLFQNYPNPFNPTTTIKFAITRRTHVRLTIYNVLGNKIIILINREMLAGTHEIIWNAKDAEGIDVSSGLYVCRLEADGYIQTRKILLMR
jgi:hypothetical protein